MRVAGVIPGYPPGSRIGAFLATHRLLAHLAARGHRVDVYAPIPQPYALDGVDVHRMSTDAQQAIADCDVVVAHLGDDDKAAQVAVRYGKPIVRMVHGLTSDVGKLCRYAYPDLVVFNSESTARAFNWQRPSIVVHPYTDVARFRVRRRHEMVTLVNLAEAKGGMLFDQLARSQQHRRFLGVKGGYGRQVFSQYRNVTIIPNTDDMRRDVYARTRVLLMPSQWETWGMVGVEAMCSGIPVIAHPTPGLRESLGSAGIFVDRRDAQGWVDALDGLDDPAAYRAASKAARARADELAPLIAAGPDRFADAVEALV